MGWPGGGGTSSGMVWGLGSRRCPAGRPRAALNAALPVPPQANTIEMQPSRCSPPDADLPMKALPHPACQAPLCPAAAPGSCRAWCPQRRCPPPGTRTARRPPAWRGPRLGGEWGTREQGDEASAGAAAPPVPRASKSPHLAPHRPCARAHRCLLAARSGGCRGLLQLQAALVDEAGRLQAQHCLVDAQRLLEGWGVSGRWRQARRT